MGALRLLVCSAAEVSCDRQWLTSFLAKPCLSCSYQIVEVEMYHIFWRKEVAGLKSTQTERWNIFGVHHFLMEANSILKVLKCLKS